MHNSLRIFLLFLGLWVSTSLWAACYGTVYFKAPASWTTVSVAYQNTAYPVIGSPENGYYVIDLSALAAGAVNWGSGNPYFFIGGAGNTSSKVDKSGFNVANRSGPNLDGPTAMACPGMGNTLYVTEDPLNPGKTYQGENPFKYFYIMIPEEVEWMSATPMISTDGGVTGIPLRVDTERCGWYYMAYKSDQVPESVVIYRDNDVKREDVIGLEGLWGTGTAVTSITLDLYFLIFDTDRLFFIPDSTAWPENADRTNQGWFTADPNVDGVCSYQLASRIYDTDVSLYPSFSCYYDDVTGNYITGNCQKGAQGVDSASAISFIRSAQGVVRKGMVLNTLTADKKPQLNTTGAGGECFPSAEIFDMMFKPTAGVNEVSRFDIPLSRASDGRWTFDSDDYIWAGVDYPGGFFPVENTTDEDIIEGSPLSAARTKRSAEGPVLYRSTWYEKDSIEGVPKIELYCNTAGWSGGVDCNGSTIQDASDLIALLPAWTSTRNHHFCLETHAYFIHKPGLTFSLHGGNDVWVFIAGKLAIDHGGLHLPAPGYVKLDLITDKNGNPLVTGNSYDLDIFFCARETAMSTFHINSNIYLRQGTDGDPNRLTNNYQYASWNISSSHRMITIENARDRSFAVMNIKGKLIHKGTVQTSSMNVSLPSSGIYLVRVGSVTQRIWVR